MEEGIIKFQFWSCEAVLFCFSIVCQQILQIVFLKLSQYKYYLENRKDFRDQILNDINLDDEVLDIGKAMRDKHKKIVCKKLETLDVNDFGDYPDIICDICSDVSGLEKKYDKIICLAILEHVYNPFKAIENLRSMLKDNGMIYGFVPYLYKYHAN